MSVEPCWQWSCDKAEKCEKDCNKCDIYAKKSCINCDFILCCIMFGFEDSEE